MDLDKEMSTGDNSTFHKEGDVIDAVKELTKVVTDLVTQMKNFEAEWQRWRKAGRY